MKYLFIDDIRNPFDYINSQHGDYVIEAKNYREAIEALKDYTIDYVYFDHDLGVDKTGYDVAKYIVEYQIKIKGFKIHSANPVGRFNIRQLMTRYGYKELS